MDTRSTSSEGDLRDPADRSESGPYPSSGSGPYPSSGSGPYPSSESGPYLGAESGAYGASESGPDLSSESGLYPSTASGSYEPAVDVVKLYNAGSFFDPRAVAEHDYGPIASTLRGVGRVVVESHPHLAGARMLRFRDACVRASRLEAPMALEVAMGLETAHPAALERLHKRITLDDFAAAAARLQREGIDLRVFLLVSVPFVPPAEQIAWLRRSVQVAFDSGASVVSLIPTRTGNGALDTLESAGHFVRPTLTDLEDALDAALPIARGRVFADLWNSEGLASCAVCARQRLRRLLAMNLTQVVLPRVECHSCSDARGVA